MSRWLWVIVSFFMLISAWFVFSFMDTIWQGPTMVEIQSSGCLISLGQDESYEQEKCFPITSKSKVLLKIKGEAQHMGQVTITLKRGSKKWYLVKHYLISEKKVIKKRFSIDPDNINIREVRASALCRSPVLYTFNMLRG